MSALLPSLDHVTINASNYFLVIGNNDRLTGVLLATGLPSFDTILYNARFRLSLNVNGCLVKIL